MPKNNYTKYGVFVILLVLFIFAVSMFARPGNIYAGGGKSTSVSYSRIGNALNYVIHGGYCDGCSDSIKLATDCKTVNVFGYWQHPYTGVVTYVYNENFTGDFSYNSPTVPGWCDSVGGCTAETLDYKCIKETVVSASPPPSTPTCTSGDVLKELCSDNVTQIATAQCVSGQWVYLTAPSLCPAPANALPIITWIIIAIVMIAAVSFLIIAVRRV
jgi:hypothetical protein